MSGHSKWSKIKRDKGAADQKRSKIFSRIVKEISVAVKEGGPDPEGNARLRLALLNAKGANMPKENITRALTKAKDADSLQEVSYEAHAPGGIALFIECLTDNTQRTVASVRAILNKRGGSLGTNGSVAYLFERKGIIVLPKPISMDFEELQLELIEEGVDDFEENEEDYTITTTIEGFIPVQRKLESMGMNIESAELQRIPLDTRELDTDSGLKVLKTIELLEEDDDVQNVFHNLLITEEMGNAL